MFLSGIHLIAGRFQHGKGLVAGHAVDDHVASLSERKHFIQSWNFRNSIVHVFADGLVFVRCGFCHADGIDAVTADTAGAGDESAVL